MFQLLNLLYGFGAYSCAHCAGGGTPPGLYDNVGGCSANIVLLLLPLWHMLQAVALHMVQVHMMVVAMGHIPVMGPGHILLPVFVVPPPSDLLIMMGFVAALLLECCGGPLFLQ